MRKFSKFFENNKQRLKKLNLKMKKLKKKINNKREEYSDTFKKIDVIYNWIIFITLTVFLIYVGIYHEPFRDENQAWNIARDLSVIDIFKQMYYEGHPCLWHLILKPLTILELPIYSMTWVSIIIMLITAWLILFKSPFNKIIRTILIFSSPFLYFYSIISRSYCLIALLVTLICIFYNKRRDKPLLYGSLIFLLFNTHVIMGGMASGLLLFFILETLKDSIKNKKILRRRFVGCFVGFLGGVVLTLQIIGGYEVNSLVSSFGVDEYNYNTKGEYINYLSEQYKTEYYYITDDYLEESTIMDIVTFLGICLAISLVFNLKNSLIFIISYGFSLFVCLALFYSIPSRSIVIVFMLMFLAWTIKENNDYIFKFKFINWIQKYHIPSYLIQLVMIVYCILSMPYGYKCAENDVNKLMTDSPEIAKFIKKNIDKDDVILSTSENLTTVILGYLPGYKFYSIENERYFSFITWDRRLDHMCDDEQLKKIIDKFKKDGKDIYYLYVDNMSYCYQNINEELLEDKRLEVIYESSNEYEYLNSAQEYVKYYIYKILE